MPALLNRNKTESHHASRIFLWGLLIIFNASLWTLLLAFHWQISLRAREVYYFGTQLFPVSSPKGVPLEVIYVSCALLTLASTAAIVRDRHNTAARERIRTLLSQILGSLEIGVVVIDDKNQLAMANDGARRLLPEIPVQYSGIGILEILRDRPALKDRVQLAMEHKEYVQEVPFDLGTSSDPWPVRVTTLPLKDPQKRTTGSLLLVHDVRDLVRMERQMQNTERLSSLGTLAAVMAHEIRNPLEAMNLNLVLLGRNLPDTQSPESKTNAPARYLKIVESEIGRLAKIVETFLSFARPSSAPAIQVRLDSILQQINDLLANQARSRKVNIELSIACPLVVRVAEHQIKQAFLNLVINALESMPNGGSLQIHAEQVAGSAVVCIRDTGVGIPPELIPKLFDPFFTTRSKGTGLGLTIVNRIIQEHNGSIRVSSIPGEGSTFTILLPLFCES